MSHTHNCYCGRHHEHEASHSVLVRIILCVVAMITMKFITVEGTPRLACFAAIYLLIGWDILREAVRNILHGEVFDENFLMVVATIGAFALAIVEDTGDYDEAIAVMLFFQIGEYFQAYAVGKSRKSIAALMGNRTGNAATCAPNLIPDFDSDANTSDSEAFITRFARYYTPVVCYGALAVAILPPLVLMIINGGYDAASTVQSFETWLYRALTFLVISCPCALVISIPLSFFAGIGGASRHGILIKGSNILERLARVKTVISSENGAEALEEAMNNRRNAKECCAYMGSEDADAPALMRADVGIAMGEKASYAAIEAADVVLTDDDTQKITKAINIARRSLGIVWQNIIMAIGIKVIVLVLSVFGITSMWLAVFADVGVLVIAVVNAMRGMYVKR